MKFLAVAAVSLFLTLIVTPSFAGECSPGRLSSQAQVDNFPVDCETVTGGLEIRGNDIVNLAALSPLKHVTGNLYLNRNPALTDIGGLANLESVSGYLRLRSNNLLANLDALTQLSSIGGNLRLDANSNLSSISGLSSLGNLGGQLRINNNDKLTSLAGLELLTSVAGNVRITGNAILGDLSGLESLATVGSYLLVQSNPQLSSLDGLASLTTISGYAYFFNNPALGSIAALSNLSDIGSYLRIRNNDSLVDLTGLESLSSLGGDLYIHGNALLANLDALSGLTAVTGFLRLDGNPGLTSIEGLAGISSIGDYLRIRGNNALTSLDGLHKLYAVENNVTIERNRNLALCSALIPLVDSYDDAAPGPGPAVGTPPAGTEVAVDVGGFILLSRNATNCNSVSEITSTALAPVFTQAFIPDTVGEANISRLTYTLDYSASLVRATEVGFINPLPAGLTVASPANETHTCTAATIAASGDTVNVSNGIVDGGTICTIAVDVLTSSVGTFVNQTEPMSFTLGTGTTSSATLNVIALNRSFSGTLPSGGAGSLSFTSDDPLCSFEGDPQFLAADAVSPAAPDTLALFDGVVSFVISDCQPGAAVELTMNYSAALPGGLNYWKSGEPWRKLPANISGSSVTFTLVDGGEFDDDGAVNGRIVDPSGAASTVALPPEPVPLNQPLPLALGSLLLALLGGLGARKALLPR